MPETGEPKQPAHQAESTGGGTEQPARRYATRREILRMGAAGVGGGL